MANVAKLQQLTRDAEELLASGSSISSEDDTVRIKAVDTLRKLTRRLETPLELSRRLAWQEPAHLISIKIALDISLLKLMQTHSSYEGQTISAMALQLKQPEELVVRILRHLAAWDTIKELDKNTFAATSTSNAFLDASVSSGLDFWIHLASIGMRNMPRYIREGNYDSLGIPGKGSFEQANGTGKHLFDWLNENPEAFRAHTDHLNAFSTDRIGWLDTFPAQERLLESADLTFPLLVDIGGGLGRDVFSFAETFPSAKGQLIVQDLPEVINDLSSKLPPDFRVTAQVHDFFTPQPVHGARAYLLHYVLHDWSDIDCLRILENIKSAMREGYSRLIVVESIIADQNADAFSTALDITIMSMVGAKERSEKHWRDLFRRAGLRVAGIHSSIGNAECVIEVVLDRNLTGPSRRDVRDNHGELIRKIAAESTVLFKNANQALPLKAPKSIATFGNDAGPTTEGPLNQQQFEFGTLAVGGGSGAALFTYLVSPLEALKTRAAEEGALVEAWLNNTQVIGRDPNGWGSSPLPNEPKVCLGFLKGLASEAVDRESLELDWQGNELVETVAAFCENTVVVTHSAGINVIPFADDENVTSILAAHYPGQGSGNSIFDVLYGDVNPSGHLPYSIAYEASDYNGPIVANNIDVRYEFGFGLSYTTFELSGLAVEPTNRDAEITTRPEDLETQPGGNPALWEALYIAETTIRNTGDVRGSAVPQLYIHFPDSTLEGTPPQQLRGFEKIELVAGQRAHEWLIPEGEFVLSVGFSSRDFAETTTLTIV